MARRYYLDTSAYLAILVREPGATALEQELEGAEVVSSVLLVLEIHRNLIRLSREGLLASEDFQRCRERLDRDLAEFQLRDLSLDLCRGVVMPVVMTPRSLDLAHLRTALWFHGQGPLTRFVTLDEPLRQSAQELGLPV